MNNFVDFSGDERFQKSDGFPAGTIRIWSDGTKRQKQADGTWKEVKNQQTGTWKIESPNEHARESFRMSDSANLSIAKLKHLGIENKYQSQPLSRQRERMVNDGIKAGILGSEMKYDPSIKEYNTFITINLLNGIIS